MLVSDPFRGVVFGINSLNASSQVAKTVRKTPRVDQKQVFIVTSMDLIAYC